MLKLISTRITLSVSIAVAFFLLAGCIMIPTGSDPAKEVQKKIQLGSDRKQVLSQLGDPLYTLDAGDSRYLLYSYAGKKGAFMLWHPYILIGGLMAAQPAPLHYSDEVVQCLLLEFKNDTLANAKVKDRIKHTDTCAMPFEDEIRPPILERLVGGDKKAAIELAKWFHELGPLRKLAWDGDREAAHELALNFDERGPLEELVRKGDLEAKKQLTSIYKNLGVDLGAIYGVGNSELYAKAEVGDPEAQLQLYFNNVPDRKKWLCASADQGHPDACYRLGVLYENGHEDVGADLRQSYKWYILAAKAGHPHGESNANRLRPLLSDYQQLAEAERLVKDWESGKCLGEVTALPPGGTRTEKQD
jgi:outer membrane protein assembly factor BamE (lipoprotein component of BamABCDE complex)